MQLIKVNATNSTNSLAREMYRDRPKMGAACIVAEQQLEGRGQRGTTWTAEAGQNLTFSIVYPSPNIPVQQQFLLSATVATAIAKNLQSLGVPKLKVKWPNDIMSANFKIGGILIENVIMDGQLAASIIGIGLNVNQVDFGTLSLAASLKLVTGQHYVLDDVLNGILNEIESALQVLHVLSSEEIMNTYKKHLFRIHTASTFQLPDKTFFTGMIEDVSPNGKLIVKLEENRVKEFDLKEIKLCY